MARLPVILFMVLGMGLPDPACAHHSRANFDLDRTIGFRATVTRYQYTNPHSFVYAQRTTESGETQDWVIELGSIPNLRRMDMGADALKAGDEVMVRGNPERDPDSRYLFLVSITTDDGHIYAMDDVFSKGRQLRERGAHQPGSRDFSGKWYMLFSRSGVLVGSARPDYPVNAAGAASLEHFNPGDDPFFECVDPGIPRMIGSPYAMEIVRPDSETILFNYEFPALQRVIHLGSNDAEQQAAPSSLGHSRGRIEDGTLIIVTDGFTAETWGIGQGLDSSPAKRIIERYSLAEDGRLLNVQVSVTDPAYLAAPLELDYSRRHVPDYELTEYIDCNLEAAGKHLELEND